MLKVRLYQEETRTKQERNRQGEMVTKRYTVHIPRKKEKLLFSNVTNIVEQGEHVLENGDNEFDFEMFIPLDALGSFHHREFGMSFGKNKLTPMGKIPSSNIYWSIFPSTWTKATLKQYYGRKEFLVKKYLFPRELGRIESIAEFHADIPWGTDKKKKVEVYIQPNVDLNAEMETLEKVF